MNVMRIKRLLRIDRNGGGLNAQASAKRRNAFGAFFMAVVMLFSMLPVPVILAANERDGGIMPLAAAGNVDVPIVSLDFNNRSNRLYNAFTDSEVSAKLQGRYTNNIYYPLNDSYGFYPASLSDMGYLTLTKSDGNGGVLDDLTKLTVEMDVQPNTLGGPYWLFYAAPDSTSSAHLGFYVQGETLTAEMVDTNGVKATCSISLGYSWGRLGYQIAYQRIRVTFTDNSIEVYTNYQNQPESIAHNILLADCVGTGGIARIGRSSDSNLYYRAFMDNIMIIGEKPDPGITEPELPGDSDQDTAKKPQRFIVRHWHAVRDPNVRYQGSSSYDTVSRRYFVIADGYIVPQKNGGYKFWLLDNSKDEYVRLTNATVTQSGYFASMDEETGEIVLTESPVKNSNNEEMDRFSGFAVSAGHAAVTTTDNTGNTGDSHIKIKYDPNIHLVKTHFFYIDNHTATQNSELFGGTSETEYDTAYIYTFVENYGNYSVGDIVEYQGSDKAHPLFYRNGLPQDLTDHGLPADLADHIQLTKVYNTAEGLHTDKTASVAKEYDDGRTFNLDLEAWYSGSSPVDVGLVLDSSGSMSFASENLKPININNADLTDEQISQLESKMSNRLGSNGWDNTFLTSEEVSWLLDPHNTDNSRLGETDYNYYVYDARDSVNEYVPMAYWEGGSANTEQKTFPDTKEKIDIETDIGGITEYYDLNGNLKNSKTGNYAYSVERSSSNPTGWYHDDEWGGGNENTDPAIVYNSTDSPKRIRLSKSTHGIGMEREDGYGQEFTVSFEIVGQLNTTNNSGLLDLLYVGTFDKNTTKGFRILMDKDGYLYKWKLGNSSPNRTTTRIISSTTDDGSFESHRITVVVSNSNTNGKSSVRVYVDDNDTGLMA